MELHTWGPALGLASIDPECLAAITFLQIYAPSHCWTLIADNDADRSPDRTLPALYIPGSATSSSTPSTSSLPLQDRWVCGFDAIVRYITDIASVDNHSATTSSKKRKRKAAASPPLPPTLTPAQRSTSAAYSSFIRSRASPLLALSLYVTSDNWLGATRPALARLLRANHPLPWTVPARLREAARIRSKHLGLGALDTDSDDLGATANASANAGVAGTTGGPSATAGTAGSGGGAFGMLRRRMQGSVSGAITPLMRSQIRLDALATDVYESLEQLLQEATAAYKADEKHDSNFNHPGQEPGSPLLLATSTPSALDCLAHAYLSLMARPAGVVPRPFLAQALMREIAAKEGAQPTEAPRQQRLQFPQLVSYVSTPLVSLVDEGVADEDKDEDEAEDGGKNDECFIVDAHGNDPTQKQKQDPKKQHQMTFQRSLAVFFGDVASLLPAGVGEAIAAWRRHTAEEKLCRTAILNRTAAKDNIEKNLESSEPRVLADSGDHTASWHQQQQQQLMLATHYWDAHNIATTALGVCAAAMLGFAVLSYNNLVRLGPGVGSTHQPWSRPITVVAAAAAAAVAAGAQERSFADGVAGAVGGEAQRMLDLAFGGA